MAFAIAVDADAGELHEVMLRTDGVAEAASRQPGWSLAASVLSLALIHPSAWKKNSANFAFWGFSEVREGSCNKYCN
jgi:hypothetical protein